MRKFFENEAGFTLLELLVVVAVIGILAAIIVPQVGDVTDDADRAAAESSLVNLQSAIEQYRLQDDARNYPATLGDMGVTSDDIDYETDVANHPETDDTADYVAVYNQAFEDADGNDEYLYVDSETTGIQTDATNPLE